MTKPEVAEERAESKAPADVRALARKLVADQLTSTKRTKADVKAQSTGVPTSSSHAEYPYGLELSLDDATLAKMKMHKLPTAGTELYLVACCKVTNTNESTSAGDTMAHRSVSLQITSLALAPEKKPVVRVKAHTRTARAAMTRS